MERNQSNIHRLKDGTLIRCRPVRPSDRTKLLAGFEHFSPESRYRRFFSATPRLTASMLDRLMDLDGEDRVAIGAERLRLGFLSGPGLGIARFTRIPGESDVAEMAVSIIDEMHGRGLGTVLLLELSAAARVHGIAHFRAWVQADNEAMKALVAKLDPLAKSHVEDGLLVFDLAVPGAVVVPTHSVMRMTDRWPGSAITGWSDGLRQLLPTRLAGYAIGR